MQRALSVEDNKLKIRPELMKDDVLYHCIVESKLMLAYRDSQKIMHCYEVEDPHVVGAVRACASYEEAEYMLEQIGAAGMNKVIKQAPSVGTTMGENNDAAEIYSEYESRSTSKDDTQSSTESHSGGSCGCSGEHDKSSSDHGESSSSSDHGESSSSSDHGESSSSSDHGDSCGCSGEHSESSSDHGDSCGCSDEHGKPSSDHAESSSSSDHGDSCGCSGEHDAPASESQSYGSESRSSDDGPESRRDSYGSESRSSDDGSESRRDSYGSESRSSDDGSESRRDSYGSESSTQSSEEPRDRSVILIGIKPIMTYVTATLTQLATLPKITIKSRGKRITQAVDVSQVIIKRMNTADYKISDVRIASDSFTSDDGRTRKISTMEIDITKP